MPNYLTIPQDGNLKVGFKLGQQSVVNQMMADDKGSNPNADHYHKAVPGTFYLTQDTHRLYVGNDDYTLSPVNQGVTFVTNLSGNDGLPELNAQTDSGRRQELQGQFYYVTSSNILCVASGNQWVQINPDTATTDFQLHTSTVSNLSTLPNYDTTNTDVVSANGDVVHLENILTQNNGHGSMTTDLYIASASPNLHIEQNGATIDGPRVIKLSCDEGDTYELVSTPYRASGASNNDPPIGVRVDVQSATSHDSVGHFILVGGSANTIVPTLDESTPGTVFIRLNGGITDYSFNLNPVLSNNEQTGELRLELQDISNNTSDYLRVNPTITIGENSDVINHFTHNSSNDGLISLNTTLDVYTTEEVDRLIERASNIANAMYFAGTLDGTYVTEDKRLESIYGTNVSNYSNGATFKITNDSISIPSGMVIDGLTGTGKSLATGDLIILQGQEYQDTVDDNSTSANPTYIAPNALDHDSKLGKLVPGTVTYHYVPSGDDNDMYHNLSFVEDTNSVKFEESVGGQQAVKDILAFDTQTSSAITIGHDSIPVAQSNDNSNTKTIHIDHSTITRTNVGATDNNNSTNIPINPQSAQSTDYNPTFDVVTLVSSDNYGHITGTTTRRINIKSPTLVSAYTTSTNITNGIQLADNVWLSSDVSPTVGEGLDFTSQSLLITGTNRVDGTSRTSVNVDLVWGAFS